MNSYDISKAFEKIEYELIASMIRNMKKHRVDEIAEDMEWEMWQVKQLAALDQYRKDNKKFKNQFGKINKSVDELIRMARADGNMSQEIAILNAIKKGYEPKITTKNTQKISGEFFDVNDRKMDALINATVNDLEKAEIAILRQAEDQYRKIIFDAQVYANSGAGTYEKAIDMATKDFISKGIQCVEYKNGARHKLDDYADMALRTASKRAYLTGEGEKRKEWGESLVIINKRGKDCPCPLCVPFVGKIMIDDVWSGGTQEDGDYPLLSKAIEAGLYHPRCRDSHTTYFRELHEDESTFTKSEIAEIEEENKEIAKQQYATRNIEKFERLENNALDSDNKKMYACKKNDLEEKLNTVDKANSVASKSIQNAYKEHTNNGVQYVPLESLDEQFIPRAKLAGMDGDLANATANQFESLANKYETTCTEIKVGKLNAIGAPAGTELQNTTMTSTITFNRSIVSNKKKFFERMDSAVERGQFPRIPKENYDKYVITHEYAHTMFNTQGSTKNYVNYNVSNMRKATKEIKKLNEQYANELMELSAKLREADLKAMETFTDEDWKAAQHIGDKYKDTLISEYSRMSADEFMAEAFAEAMLSNNPSKYSVKVLKIIDKYFKK